MDVKGKNLSASLKRKWIKGIVFHSFSSTFARVSKDVIAKFPYCIIDDAKINGID